MLPRARTVSEVPNGTNQRSLDRPPIFERHPCHPDTMTCGYQILTRAAIPSPIVAYVSSSQPPSSCPRCEPVGFEQHLWPGQYLWPAPGSAPGPLSMATRALMAATSPARRDGNTGGVSCDDTLLTGRILAVSAGRAANVAGKTVEAIGPVSRSSASSSCVSRACPRNCRNNPANSATGCPRVPA